MFTINFDGKTVTSTNGRDIYMVSYSPTGNVRWLTSAGGVNTDCGLDMTIKPNGNIALCGYYLNTCKFGDIELDYGEYNDLFIAEFDPPIVSGIEYINEIDVKVYPNPVSDVLNIAVDGDAEVEIYDVMGQIIYKSKSIHPIDVSAWNCGIYNIKLMNSSGKAAFRFVKQ